MTETPGLHNSLRFDLESSDIEKRSLFGDVGKRRWADIGQELRTTSQRKGRELPQIA